MELAQDNKLYQQFHDFKLSLSDEDKQTTLMQLIEEDSKKESH